jgi:glycosyltransferase involved in cell wall biosynthesis
MHDTVNGGRYRPRRGNISNGEEAMRIAFLSTMSGYYGGEVHLAGLASGLSRRGHSVLCLARKDSLLLDRLQRLGLPAMGVPACHWYEALHVARIRSRLVQFGAHVLHTHLPRDYYTAAAATLGTGTVNVGTRHQLFPIGAPAFKRPFLGRFAALIAVSEAVRTPLTASDVLPAGRIHTVPNGIQAGPVGRSGSPAAGPLRVACGARAADPVVGFVGRLCESKGVDVLVRAAALLHRSWPRLKVCIIGEQDGSGRYLARLRQEVAAGGLQDVVHFLGYRPDAARAGREFDVQVLPSRAEPFGLVTLEAMAQACPVVVTDSGGSPEIVRDGVEGFLVRPGDAAQLAGRLDVLLDSPGLCREMGRRGRRRVVEDFSLEMMLDRTEQVYRQALGRPAASVAAD